MIPIAEPCPDANPDCDRCGGSGVRIDFFPGSADSGSTYDCECTWDGDATAAPTIIPADAAPGSEGIFKALLGLRTEEKIIALANALHAAGVTIHRLDEDGEPIIRAVLPNALGTCTVLNL